MAHDRNDPRETPRDERSRWREGRFEGRERGDRDDRGFFDRAGDEVASWFGDDEAERRRHEDRMRDERERGGSPRDYQRDPNRDRGDDRGRFFGSDRDRDWNENRGPFSRTGRDRGFEPDRDYRPVTGDYGRSEQFFAAGGAPRGGFGRGEGDRSSYERSQSPWGRDERTSIAGTQDRSRDFDPHYDSLRQRHMSELDRDYDEYRREHQAKFESDFGNWRERRQQKRGLLAQIREHMEVVGSDDEHVGTIDKVAGDRIILTKSDPDSGGAHHSLSCSEIDRVEGERVILDCTAEQAKQRWRDESRSRALFERDDQGEMGPHILDRSFEGTYR
jgi:hypothetical protein